MHMHRDPSACERTNLHAQAYVYMSRSVGSRTYTHMAQCSTTTCDMGVCTVGSYCEYGWCEQLQGCDASSGTCGPRGIPLWLTPYPHRGSSSEPSMAVAALGRPPGAPPGLRAVPVWSRANAVFSCVFGVASYSRAFCTLFRGPLHGRFPSLRAPTQPWRHCIQTLTKGYSLPNSVVS